MERRGGGPSAVPQAQAPQRKRGRPSKVDMGARATRRRPIKPRPSALSPRQVGGAVPEAQVPELDAVRHSRPMGDGLSLARWCGRTYIHARLECAPPKRCQCLRSFELHLALRTSLFGYFSTSDLFSNIPKQILRYNIQFFFVVVEEIVRLTSTIDTGPFRWCAL